LKVKSSDPVTVFNALTRRIYGVEATPSERFVSRAGIVKLPSRMGVAGRFVVNALTRRIYGVEATPFERSAARAGIVQDYPLEWA
jgi:hypothetical protein